MKINCRFESKYHHTMDLKPQTSGSAGLDLIADLELDTIIRANSSMIVGTGFYVEIPENYFGLLAIRSSIGFKHDVCLANGIGVIDSDYRGEIKLKLINNSNTDYVITAGSRIAQLLIMANPSITYVQVNDLNNTERGEGGFGSTDLKELSIEFRANKYIDERISEHAEKLWNQYKDKKLY